MTDEPNPEVEDEAGAAADPSPVVKTASGTILGIDQGAEALLAVALLWVTGAVFLIIERENEYVRFHAFQSVILFLGLTVVGTVATAIPLVGWLIALAVAPVTVVLWILLMMKAYEGGATGERFKIPIIGDIAESNLKSLPKF
jgi:uncharacterized membrane protein